MWRSQRKGYSVLTGDGQSAFWSGSDMQPPIHRATKAKRAMGSLLNASVITPITTCCSLSPAACTSIINMVPSAWPIIFAWACPATAALGTMALPAYSAVCRQAASAQSRSRESASEYLFAPGLVYLNTAALGPTTRLVLEWTLEAWNQLESDFR
jgi:hypothetical protein